MTRPQTSISGFAVLLLCACLLLPGCLKHNVGSLSMQEEGDEAGDRSSLSAAQRFSYDYQSAALVQMEENVPFSSSLLLRGAKTAIGTPYIAGGTNLRGFDCSGFVQWAYRQVGIPLPRTAREQSSFGIPINTEDMVAGDIVTFRHPRRGYHTGIYVGDGKFVHSPRPRKNVSISSLDDPYFSRIFTGARRVALSEEADAAITQSLLAEYGRQESAPSRKVVTTRKKQKSSTVRTVRKHSVQKKTVAKKSAVKSGVQQKTATRKAVTPQKVSYSSAPKKNSR